MLTVGIIVALAAVAMYAMNSKSKSVLPWIGIAKAKQVNDSSLDYIRRRLSALEGQSRVSTVSPAVMPSISHGPFSEGYAELTLADGTHVRFWLPDEDSDVQSLMQRLAQDARNSVSESSADLAKRLAEESGANAVQVTRGSPTCRIGAVHYRVWP